ncbi:MAG: hypothetical protein JWN51_1127 [Phycisphaerales bacterium]|nr:hypothetical protein [Phycisphaerales bacterium]
MGTYMLLARNRHSDGAEADASHPPAASCGHVAQRTTLHRHAPLLMLVPVLAIFVWMVTCGTGRLFAPEDFGQFYDAQARSLLQGRWDVEPASLRNEAFIRDGKRYGYFGFVPAVPRMALNRLFPAMEGRWSRLSLTLACAVTLSVLHLLVLKAGEFFPASAAIPARLSVAARSVFLLSAGLGSTLIFLGSRAYVFHEALIWGAALALACCYAVMCWLVRPRRWLLVLACGLASAAFFTRAPSGSGAVAAIGLLGVSALWRRRAWFDAVAPLAAVGLTVACFVGVNYAKFRTTFEGVPLRMYSPMIADPARFANTGGRLMSLANVRSTSLAYFSASSVRVAPSFPWLYLALDTAVLPEARLDVIEPFAGMPVAMPALLALAAIGLVVVPHRRATGGATAALPVRAVLLGGATVLAANAISYRYVHDLFPALVACGAFGLHAVLHIRRPALRGAILAAGLPLVLFGIYANCAFALVFQREMVGGTPAAPAREFRAWRAAVDGFMSPSPAASSRSEIPPP